MVVLIVYVNDIIISGSDVIGIEEVKGYLKKAFQTNDLLHYFLGIKVVDSRGEIVLS